MSPGQGQSLKGRKLAPKLICFSCRGYPFTPFQMRNNGRQQWKRASGCSKDPSLPAPELLPHPWESTTVKWRIVLFIPSLSIIHTTSPLTMAGSVLCFPSISPPRTPPRSAERLCPRTREGEAVKALTQPQKGPSALQKGAAWRSRF